MLKFMCSFLFPCLFRIELEILILFHSKHYSNYEFKADFLSLNTDFFVVVVYTRDFFVQQHNTAFEPRLLDTVGLPGYVTLYLLTLLCSRSLEA